MKDDDGSRDKVGSFVARKEDCAAGPLCIALAHRLILSPRQFDAITATVARSYFAYGDGIGFSKTIKTCTAVFTVVVLIRIGRQPSAVRVASAVSIAGAVSLMI